MEGASKSTKIILGPQFIEELKRKHEERKDVVANDKYISWLEQFTLVYKCFNDDNWLYNPEGLSEDDAKNVRKISSFFGALSEYCNRYYINIACNNRYEVEHINIKHNGVGYQIGLLVGQGSLIYVERDEPKYDAIEFMDIVNDIPPSDFEAKKELLKKFEQIVMEIKALDISKAVIMDIVDK